MSLRFRQILAVLLAFVGVDFWLLTFRGLWGQTIHVELLAGALVLPWIPGVAPAAWLVLKRLHRPTVAVRRVTTVLVTLTAGFFLARYAITSHRDLFPFLHDENQFLLQARMLSVGRLWMPGLPLYDFFDTFYVLIQPKYAAQSFPGAAILFVPSIWLGIASWKWAILLSAVTVGLLYRVTTEFIGGLPGLMAAILLSKVSIFQYVSTMVLAQVPVTMLGLATIWAYQRWRKTRSARSAAFLGFVSGLAFITRPADALIFMIPIGLAVLLDLRRFSLSRFIVAGLAGALPWLSLMLIFNRGVTGHWLTSPFDFYNRRDQPGLVYGLSAQNPGNPITKIPEKRDYYLGGVVYRIKEHRPDLFWNSFTDERYPQTVPVCIPHPFFGFFLPIGLILWPRQKSWVLACGVPMFFLLYLPYPIFIQHYVVVAAPAEVFGVVLGIAAIARTWPRWKAGIWTAAMIFVVGFAFTRSTEIAPMQNALVFHCDVLKVANETTAALAAKGQPAVVLFYRGSGVADDWEPVYNVETAWPMDATIIRAHNRGGGENWKIFKYFATHGPDRAFYRFDETNLGNPLTYLGMASELSRISPGSLDGQDAGP